MKNIFYPALFSLISSNVNAFSSLVAVDKSKVGSWKPDGIRRTEQRIPVSNTYVDQLSKKEISIPSPIPSSISTEVNRVKLQLNEAKSNLKASEEKAAVAESRVENLTKTIEKMELEKRSLELSWRKRLERDTKMLRQKVSSFADALQKLKFDSHNEKFTLRMDYEGKMSVLEKSLSQVKSDLEEAKVELESASREASKNREELIVVRKDMTDQLFTLRSESQQKLDETTKEYTSQINKLNSDINYVRMDMTEQLIASKKSSAQEVSALKTKMNRDLAVELSRRKLVEQEKEDMSKVKEELELERQSLRSLGKIYTKLLRQKIKERAMRIARKFDRSDSQDKE